MLTETTVRECVSFAGLFKPGARRERLGQLKAPFERAGASFGTTLSIVEGRNSVLFMHGAARAKRQANAPGCGGSCLVSFRDGAERNEGGIFPDKGVLSFIEGLSGSWAVADVDDGRGVLLARDFAGAQSVYFCVINGCLYFASNLNWFKALPLTISVEALSDFLHFLYIPAPGTIYREAEAVLPGEAVLYDGARITRKMLSRTNGCVIPAPEAGAGSSLERYEELLKKSVQRACPKDSRAALLLSGGKDSSALAIAVGLSGLENVEAVTLGFEESEIDESADAGVVAGHLGIPFRALRFTAEEYFKYLPGYAASLGQPFGDAAAMPLYAAMEGLRDRYGVYIDGTGNDRYFGIPTTWQEDVAWQAHRSLPGLDRLPWGVLAAGLSYSVDSISRSLGRRREEQFVSWKGFSAPEIESLTGRRPDWSSRSLYRMYASASSAMDHKTRTLCEIWEPEAAYRKTVQMANVHGKPVRYPFLDNELLEYSEGLPEGLRFCKRTNKVIIRKLLEKHLPSGIVSKKKGAFSFPKKYILDANGFEYVRSFLSKEALAGYGAVEPSAAAGYAEAYMKGDKGQQDKVWALLLLHAWLEFGR